MANISSPHVTSDEPNYSSPVPVIGLYIAGATMVCLLFIISDVINGIRLRKPWFPCRFFPLNSVTLTLIGIASKIPVDLTTAMPSRVDQLSKLTGTTTICICMCFLVPSLGTNKHSECLSNMTALTIFVVTVVVNISIQISTGLISSFIPEHIIIMVFMLMLLSLLWVSALYINKSKEFSVDQSLNIRVFEMSKGSMLKRLQMCYLDAFNRDPQFVLSKDWGCCFYNLVSLSCLFIVLEVTFRSIVLHGTRIFSASSDYGWSMGMIVISQILLVLLGSLATTYRSFVMLGHMEEEDSLSYILKFTEHNGVLSGSEPFLGISWEELFYKLLKIVMCISYALTICVLFLPVVIQNFSYSRIFRFICKSGKSEDIEEYKDLKDGNYLVILDDWTFKKCVEDMKRWMRANKGNVQIPLTQQLLMKIPLSQEYLENYNNSLRPDNYAVSCLDVVFLVKVASVVIPSTLSGSLTKILSEVFDVIHFIDTRMNSLRPYNRENCVIAKAMWMGKDFSILLPKIFKLPMYQLADYESDFDRMALIIRGFSCVMPKYIRNATGCGLGSEDRRYTSTEELYGVIEQRLVNMLHILVAQFPEAIFKEISESTVEEHEEKVRSALKLLCKVESLEGLVQWSFPVGNNITSLIAEASVTDNSTSTSEAVSDHRVHASHHEEIPE